MTAVVVHVLGEPIPQGSLRALGRGRIVSDNDRLRPWRDSVAWHVRDAMAGREPLTGPLLVDALFVLPRPPSVPKKRWAPEKKPDIDKLLRAAFDAVTAGGGWVDDAQAVKVVMEKAYPEPGEVPHLRLTVSPLANPAEVAA